MFWKLIKDKRCSSQLGSFMIDGRLTNSPQETVSKDLTDGTAGS